MAKQLLDLLTYENPVLRNYAFWAAILVIKTVLMSLYTGVQRSLTKVLIVAVYIYLFNIHFLIHKFVLQTYSNEEDVRNSDFEVKFGEEKVERIRRAHLNDLENILPYILISFIYMLTDPMPIVAVNLMRVAAGFRIWHTIVYCIFVIPQPARTFGFVIPLCIIVYMSVMSAICFVN